MRAGAGGERNDALSPDFVDFIACLDEQKVGFVLVGAYALGVHGVVRATGDLDVLYRRSRANVRRLLTAMQEFGAPAEIIDEEALLTQDIVTQFGQPPYRIDLLNAIDGVTFAEVWKGAVAVAIGEHLVRVIGIHELKKNKRASGRKKDKDDLRRLDSIR
jgi:hypothetical protein